MQPEKVNSTWYWWDADNITPTDHSCVIGSMFRLLKGGFMGLYYRAYSSEKEALDDIQQASEEHAKNLAQK